MIVVIPTIQLIILPLAANYEVSNIQLAIVNHDHSQATTQFIQKILSSGYFKLKASSDSYDKMFHLLSKDQIDLILEIPNDFDKHLQRGEAQKLLIAVHAINGVKANLGASYLNEIIKDYSSQINLEFLEKNGGRSPQVLQISTSFWYNPLMKYKYFMVPGILAILVTMVGSYMSALNIVKEKEAGTIEQINVSSIRKYQFILGKLIPFWILGIMVFSIGLLVSRIIYGIVPQGNLPTLYLFIAIYLVAVLGLGLLISTFCDTQQQAMFIAFFFVMIFILLGGLFTPIDSMPEWAQFIAYANPVTYLIEVMRMVVLKGSGFADLKRHFLIVGAYAIGFNVLAVLNYRKTIN